MMKDLRLPDAAIPSADTLIDRARALIPVLRGRSPAAEKARQCPVETIADVRAAGLFRIVQPRRYGGYGMDWDVLCKVAMELGQGCGGQAWAAVVLADHPCLAGMFSKEAQDDVWGENPDTLVSTSYGPRGTVKKVDGGYVLNGRWMFSSGVVHSGWTIVGGFVGADVQRGVGGDGDVVVQHHRVGVLDAAAEVGFGGGVHRGHVRDVAEQVALGLQVVGDEIGHNHFEAGHGECSRGRFICVVSRAETFRSRALA